MLYKEMLLIGEDYDYFIEMDPAGNGIRFMRVGDDDIRKWVAAIIGTVTALRLPCSRSKA